MAEAFTFTKTIHHDTYDHISPNKSDLIGRTVLITGASRGIGRAFAVSYTCARVSGIIVAARGDLTTTRDAIAAAAKEANLPGPKILSLSVNVTSQASVKAAAAEVSSTFPEGIDIIVSNAGILEKAVPLADADVDDWWRTYEINTKGTFLICRSFIPLLLKKNTGLKNIAIITSIGALMLLPGMSAYNNAKLASLRLAEYIDLEYSSQGITAFSLHPGGVDTELARNLDESMHASLTETPELAADTVVWLTRERREWVGGRFVNTQWDMGELEDRKGEIEERGLLRVQVKF